MDALSEFDLIRRYFTHPVRDPDVLLGIGDDAALLRPPPGELLAVTTDTLIAGRHFPHDTPADAVGHKTLAVNLSDLAAMGATPRWILLALSLPAVDETWLAGLSQGLRALADAHGVTLIGGDTTRGELSLTITAIGTVPAGQALMRSGARPGDRIYVSGTPGDAGLGLRATLTPAGVQLSAGHRVYVKDRLDRPTPRIALGLALRGRATACLDVSDGLAQDLGHILKASGVGAELWLEKLPLSPALQSLPVEDAWSLALSSGDDYELCFTLPPELDPIQLNLPEPVTCIGVITAEPGLRVFSGNIPVSVKSDGYQHFQSAAGHALYGEAPPVVSS